MKAKGIFRIIGLPIALLDICLCAVLYDEVNLHLMPKAEITLTETDDLIFKGRRYPLKSRYDAFAIRKVLPDYSCVKIAGLESAEAVLLWRLLSPIPPENIAHYDSDSYHVPHVIEWTLEIDDGRVCPFHFWEQGCDVQADRSLTNGIHVTIGEPESVRSFMSLSKQRFDASYLQMYCRPSETKGSAIVDIVRHYMDNTTNFNAIYITAF